MQTTAEAKSDRTAAIAINRMAYQVYRHWMLAFSLLYGTYIGLPFLAPVFMKLNLAPLGRAIYFIYSFLCHQLPERSFFLFGPYIMPPLSAIYASYKVTNNPMILRQFIGTDSLGWKVAWSDRMVYMFTSILVFAWLWYLMKDRLPKISWEINILFILPMAIDGSTHFLSDLAGLHQGFRDSNAWLAALTNHALAPAFYAGDGWGSFNSLMRMLSGILFGLGLVWWGFPYIEAVFREQADWIRYKFQRANLPLD